MAFSDYKNISQVQKRFGIRYKEEDFIVVQEDVGPSACFVEEFEFNTEHLDIYTSEASRSETVIFPMLREVYKKYCYNYSLWIQKTVSYDDDLTGTPDYTDPTLVFPGTKIADFKNIPFLTCFHDFWGQKQSFSSNSI